MSESEHIPSSGDLVWLDFDPVLGHEQAGRRPALVLSGKSYARSSGLSIVVPVTSRAKGYPFEVPLAPSQKTRGVVLADAVRCIAFRERNVEFVERGGLHDPDRRDSLASAYPRTRGGVLRDRMILPNLPRLAGRS